MHVARTGERSGAYSVLMKKPEVKRAFGKPSRRWRDNINMNLK